MKSLILKSLFIATLLPAFGERPLPVSTQSGTLSGVLLDEASNLRVYRGIPYAAPPVGDLRWRPPQPPIKWDGIRVCDSFSKVAPQKLRDKATAVISEDCLYLNVWTKQAQQPNAKLPVMVWIHGGGLNTSWGHKGMYDGTAFAKRGVVLVTINYRLGALGFLAHPGLSAESETGISGNYGFLDQIAALKWVKANIAQFGGDPDNVTIFGESAGGTSVSVLCASPFAKGLFHRAIIQSPWMFGYIDQIAAPNIVHLKSKTANTPSAEDLGLEWAKKHTEGLVGEAAVQNLRALTPDEIIQTVGYYRTRATVDGQVLPDHPAAIFAAGKQADVPTMIGTTKDEGNYFIGWTTKTENRDEFVAQLRKHYDDQADTVATLYPGETPKALQVAAATFVTDNWFVQPARQLLEGMRTVSSPAYQYQFSHPSRQNPDLGAPHAIELTYVFNTLSNADNRPTDQKLSDRVTDYWTQFARTGDPNYEGASQWPAYDTKQRRYLNLAETFEVRSRLKERECDIIDAAFPETWLPATSSALDVTQGWRFTTGDDAAWARPEFDDSAWNPIEVGKPWEKAGHKGYDGYGWYRLRVSVPKTESNGAYFEHYQKLTLVLGAVDDVDVTYFNGVEVGRTGSAPDDTQGHKETIRRYDVPAEHVRWDAENVIAVRVFDSGGDGGIRKGTPALSAPVWQEFVAVDLGPGRGDGIHPAGAPMDLTASIRNAAFETLEGTVRWQVESDTWLVDKRRSFADVSTPLKLPAGKPHAVALKFEPPTAGFYQVTCSFKRDGEEATVSQSRMRGYAPEKMDRPPQPPENLRSFWNETIAELATVAPQYKVEPSPKWSTKQTNCFLVEMRSLGDVRIRGWFEVPRSAGPHPVLLRVPGYTQGMMPTQSISDMAVLSLNIRGHGNSTDDEPGFYWGGGADDYLLRGLDDPQKFFYRGAVMDCLRGVDFVASRPEVDTQRIGITGGSQGGMLSFAAAALDQRIALSAPDIPFVVDSMKGFKMTGWPGMVIWGWHARDPKRNTWELAGETFSYVDPKNLAGWVECPILMGVGLQDNVAPAPTAFAAYNQIRSPKDYRVYPEAGHGTPPEHVATKMAWIRKQFDLAE